LLKKLLIALAAALAFLVAIFFMVGGAPGIAGMMLPDFAELQPPKTRLKAKDVGEIAFASATPYDLDVLFADPSLAIPTTGTGSLTMPEGASRKNPVPLMILLHGSGGISPGREREYARFFKKAGYATFVVDYYMPRGVTRQTDYMTKVIAVTEFDAISDAYNALRLLSTHPRIDAERIGLMGFSYGGMAARFAMDDRLREALAPELRGFAAFIDVYGPCFQVLGTKKSNGAPLLTLRGTKDASNDLAACKKREDELRALGLDVEAHVFEGAGHAWENRRKRELFPDAPYIAGCEVHYDDQGHSRVNDQPIVSVPPETPRLERVVTRMRSGGALQDCLRSGYVVGRDDKTKAKANAAILAFLARAFGA
jgi:dienelactone hydrolase